jgi:outer membrane usher protein
MRAPQPHRGNDVRCSLRGALLALALALGVSIAPPARASPDQAGGRALQLEVFINGETRNVIAAFAELPERGLAATRNELKEIGIKAPGDGADEELIPLTGMAGVTYNYDEPRQRIDITATDERRMPHVVDARGAAKRLDPAQAGYGAALNYTLFASSVTEFDDKVFAFSGASAQLDGRLFTPLGYLQQTGIVGTTVASEVDLLRLETTLAYSDPDTAITYRAGDAISRGPVWARPIRFGGLQVERNFALRPDLITAPLPATSGSAAVPSTVEVFVDNVRTFSREVPAGPYSITNLPALSGSGTARVVLRDASGRQIETNLPFFASPQLLREGFVDFSVQAGYPRLNYAIESNTYADTLFGSGGVRYGLWDNLTLEGHAEAGGDLYNGGVGLVTNAGAFGVLSVAGRASHYRGEVGFQGFASFETRLLGLSLGVSTQRSFGAFEDLASLTNLFATSDPRDRYGRRWRDDPTYIDPVTTGSISRNLRAPQALDRISIGVPLPALRANLGASVINLDRGLGDRSRVVAASYSQTFGRNIGFSVNVFTDLERPKEAGGIFASLTVPLGEEVLASVGTASNRNGTYITADASKPLGLEPGSYGWRVRDVEGGDRSYRSAAGAYRSGIARTEVAVEQVGRGARVAGEIDGAIAATSAGVFMANRIDDAFAVVDVGAPDVEVFLENRSIGKTGSSGKILVPRLQSYQRNRIKIDPTNLPVDADIGRTDEAVVPATRAGVNLDFGIETQSRSATIILHDRDGQPLRAGLVGKREGQDEPFIVGYDGRTYLRRLEPSNTVIIELPEGECRASFDYAPEPGRQVTVGPIKCL